MPIFLKYLITAAIVVLVSEIAQRSDRLGAFIAALPMVTMLVMIWLHIERQGAEKIGNHAWLTFWYVLPTLPMFLAIPWMLNRGWNFWLVLLCYALVTAALFGATAVALRRFDIHLL